MAAGGADRTFPSSHNVLLGSAGLPSLLTSVQVLFPGDVPGAALKAYTGPRNVLRGLNCLYVES